MTERTNQEWLNALWNAPLLLAKGRPQQEGQGISVPVHTAHPTRQGALKL